MDDGTIAMEALPPGCKLIGDTYEIVPEFFYSDNLIPNDEHTAKLITELGNRISSFINLTCDYPSNNQSGYMPVLDVQVKVENNKIIYNF